MRLRFLVLTLLVSCSMNGSARADDHYYIAIFGVQGQPNRPRFAHTFATFVKASDPDDSPKDCSDIVAEPRLNTGTAHGNAASLMVLNHLSGFVEKLQKDSSWLRDRLRLNKANVRVAEGKLR